MILLRCYARLGRRHWDVMAPLAGPQRPYGALAAILWRPVSAVTSLRLFWACSKLGGDLGDLTPSAAPPRRSMRSYNDPAADFADRNEVAVLCDWGIKDMYMRYRFHAALLAKNAMSIIHYAIGLVFSIYGYAHSMMCFSRPLFQVARQDTPSPRWESDLC